MSKLFAALFIKRPTIYNNNFDSPTKLFLGLHIAKFLDILAKSVMHTAHKTLNFFKY